MEVTRGNRGNSVMGTECSDSNVEGMTKMWHNEHQTNLVCVVVRMGCCVEVYLPVREYISGRLV